MFKTAISRRRYVFTLFVFLLLGASYTSSQQSLVLVAAGSGLPETLYQNLNGEFTRSNARVAVRFLPMGTEEGERQMRKGEADLGGGDFPLSSTGTAADRGKVLQVPVAVVGIAIVCNVPGVNQELNLSGPVLADIFLSKITKWDHPEIARLNPNVKLPNAGILVLHRSEGKGANYVITDYLSRVSPEFKSRVGRSLSPNWVTGTTLARAEDILFQVKDSEGAIGYVETDLAIKANVPLAHIKNAEGNFVRPAPTSLAAAAESAGAGEDPQSLIMNGPGRESYPIASFTWLYIPEKAKSAERHQSVKSYVNWLLGPGQALVPKYGFAPLPASLAAKYKAKLNAKP
jgi:phosphate transport system substrate-binding protein